MAFISHLGRSEFIPISETAGNALSRRLWGRKPLNTGDMTKSFNELLLAHLVNLPCQRLIFQFIKFSHSS